MILPYTLFFMHFLGYNALGGLEVVHIKAKATIKCAAREGKGWEVKTLFKLLERLGNQLTKIAVSKKKSEKQIHHQTVSTAPFISTSVVLIEHLTAGSWKINVFSLTREWLNDSQMQK